MLAALKKPPPKLYFPSFVNLDGFLARFKEAQRKEGFGRAYNKTRMESTLRKGTLVGSDYNGNKYYEDRDAPYGRTRWVEYPTPPGVWAIEQKYDGSMVSPEWHGWLHYMHDKTGAQLAAELEKPFKQAHTINQTMLRPEFSREGLDPPQPPEFHQPPGTYAARVARGRVGAKYEQWSGQPSTANPELRNYADNSSTLHIP
jgi:NADH dehydrogenase (ubiquinone) 1 alpha subcomplex subunit 12